MLNNLIKQYNFSICLNNLILLFFLDKEEILENIKSWVSN